MDDLQIFTNAQFGQIRGIEIDGEPWLVGKDIAQVLGYSNPSKAIIDHVDNEDKRSIMVAFGADSQNGNLPTGQAKTAIINESGVYSLIFGSKLPDAKAFKHWVTHDVLPAIRKHGAYSIHKPASMVEMFAMQAQINLDADRRMNAIESKQDAQDHKLKSIAEAFSAAPTEEEEWKQNAKKTIDSIIESNGLGYQEYYNTLYDTFEARAGAKLGIRQQNEKNRLKAQGATAERIRQISKLYIIAHNKRFRAIFDGILREEKAKHICESETP